MIFADLSIDLLSVITAYLHYLDVANLWFSGCTALNTKFANGGVAQMTLHVDTRLGRFSWPNFLYKLPCLTRFAFKDWYHTGGSRISAPLLATWSSIKVLNLNCPGAFPALQSLLYADAGSFSALEVLEIYIWAGECDDNPMQTIWPRSLLSLTLSSNTTFAKLVLDLSSLPPHLTTLIGEFCEITNPANGGFPDSLTKLELSLKCLSCDPVPLLPAGLKDLYLYRKTTATYTHADFDAWARNSIPLLPRGLTSLDWVGSLKSTRDELRAVAEALPLLTSLRIGAAVQDSHLEVLPALVEDYSVLGMFFIPVTKDKCSSIPRCLTKIGVDLSTLPHLKPNSNVQAFVHGPIYSNSFFKEMSDLQLSNLSPFITSLKFQLWDSTFPCEALPKTLTLLTLETGALSDHQLSALPNTLISLSMTETAWIGDNVEGWKLLPRRLENLYLSAVPPLPAESSTWLPTTLQELKIIQGGSQQNPPTEWYTGLPRSLRFLHLSLDLSDPSTSSSSIPFPTTLSSIFLRLIVPSEEAEARNASHNVIASLPPLLDWLDVSHDSNIVFPADTLKILPRRLRHLNMPKNDLLTDSDASLLPRSLTSHYFGSRLLNWKA